jgi:type IV secretory pathway TraG/TraD family ATPase VirD4
MRSLAPNQRRTRAQPTAQSKLVLFEDPLVCANTAGSDFRGEDLIGGKRPMSVVRWCLPHPCVSSWL